MACVSFDAISPPIDPPFAVPPAVATALMTCLDDLGNCLQTLLLLLLEGGSSSSFIPADAVAPTASYVSLLPYSGLVNDLNLPLLLLFFRSLPSTLPLCQSTSQSR